MAHDLLQFSPKGIYCPQADVFIDPWKPVERAIITHAHADHARPGMREYLATPLTASIMRHRIGSSISVQEHHYGSTLNINGVQFSFHPAGHIPGSAQVRIEYKGEIWVCSGDYKLHHDGISTPFEPVSCHTFITESTFGLPLFQWPDSKNVLEQIKCWIQENKAENKNSVLVAYSLGKAQRLIKALSSPGEPVWVHGAISGIQEAFESMGHKMGECRLWEKDMKRSDTGGKLIIAPPAVLGSRWIKKFQPYDLAMASGWMSLRGTRRQRGADKGFIMSDHADWNELNKAVKETGAERIIVTHGYTHQYARYLQECGFNAEAVETLFGDTEEET